MTNGRRGKDGKDRERFFRGPLPSARASLGKQLIWAPPGSQMTPSSDEAGGRAAVLYPACCADVEPAGPDGIRRRGSHLNIELKGSNSLSECPRPGPTCLAHHTRGRLLSLKAVVRFVLARQAACHASGRHA